MNTNKLTFAKRASRLINHYKRAGWDNIEKKALEKGLQSLQEEQEMFKSMNGLTGENDYNQNQKQFWGKGESEVGPEGYVFPGSFYTFPGSETPLVSAPDMGSNADLIETAGVTSGTPLVPSGESGANYDWMKGTNIPAKSAETNQYPYYTSTTPSLISGVAGTVGNVLLASQQKKLPKIKLPRLTSEDVSYAPARELAAREAVKGSTRAKYNIARGSRTRGEYLANTGLAETELSGKLGEVLSQSKQEEALVNANMRRGMNQANAEMAAKETLYNTEQTARTKAEKEAYLSAAMQNVGATSRDINQIKSQDALINALGEKYGWFMEKNPNAKWYQPKYTRRTGFRKK